jgi:rare lipoprotein A
MSVFTQKQKRVELFLREMFFRRPVHAGSALIVALAAIAASCHHPRARAVTPPPPARIGMTETGIASWYGFPYDGRQTASGEVYDMHQLTAAHRNLPFQTWVRVENLTNGKRVEVRITDRGPFVRNRIIDLSQTAAGKIDMLRPGTARVRLTVIARPKTALSETSVPYTVGPSTSSVPRPADGTSPPIVSTSRAPSLPSPSAPASASPTHVIPMPRYAVQAGAFTDRERAEAQRENMTAAFADARTLLDPTHNPPFWRVLVGREMTLDQANELAGRVRSEAGAGFVVPEPGPSPQ